MKLFRAVFASVGVAFTLGTPVPSLGQPATLPSAHEEWVRGDSVGEYVGKDLFLLIDGGADLFFEYGFVRALSTEYSNLPGAAVTVELYEMKDPAAAYGLFTSFAVGMGATVAIGQEAVLGDGYCIFWKGPFVGMLTAVSVDSSSGKLLLNLAEGVQSAIHQTGRRPDLCTRLREGGFDSRTMVFVRGKLALGNHFSYGWAKLLAPAKGVVGGHGGSQYLILEYVDTTLADAGLRAVEREWKKLGLSVEQDFERRIAVEQGDGGMVVLEQRGRYILGVVGKRGESEALGVRLREILEW